jgi:hypothetical protein
LYNLPYLKRNEEIAETGQSEPANTAPTGLVDAVNMQNWVIKLLILAISEGKS